jgi:hypothetical protein
MECSETDPGDSSLASRTAMPTVFLRRLLDRINPHLQGEPGHTTFERQVLGGRWLALRRLGAGLALEDLAHSVGVPAMTLLLLETGLGDTSLAAPGQWQQLSQLLATGQAGASVVGQVIAHALGEGADDLAMQRVMADLLVVDSQPEVTSHLFC